MLQKRSVTMGDKGGLRSGNNCVKVKVGGAGFEVNGWTGKGVGRKWEKGKGSIRVRVVWTGM